MANNRNISEVDLAVFGGTPAGIAAAVRGARQGLDVVLISAYEHIGGMLTNGLGVMDRLYTGRRAPIFDEIVDGIIDYYRQTYGANSQQLKDCIDTRLTYEPHIAELVLNKLIDNTQNLAVLKPYFPTEVQRTRNQIDEVQFQSRVSGVTGHDIKATTFIDASYEGDLAALADVPYRVGRESRREFNEPHAGRIFTTHGFGAYPLEAAEGTLKLDTFPVTSQLIFSGSTGDGDKAIQAYTYRVCLTSDPEIQIPIKCPPEYDRNKYVGVVESEHESRGKKHYLKSQLVVEDVKNYRIRGARIPNSKISWNDPNLPEINHAYPEADWDQRSDIARQHKEHALGLLYFLQNDDAVPENVRDDMKKWGMPHDEFADTSHFPWEMYVREARRIVGRYVFTEQDASLASSFGRTPIHNDSIALADWPMDSHECRLERQPGSLYDGKFLLSEKTRPSQIPYRTLLPKEIENLIVTVCISATHVAYGTIRVEPVLMQLGEVAGFAAAVAKEQNVSPGQISAESLQHRLVENGFALTFFNDAEIGNGDRRSVAMQYLGTKGFFPDYDARADDQLTNGTAELWAKACSSLLRDDHDSNYIARRIHELQSETDIPIKRSEFIDLLEQEPDSDGTKLDSPLVAESDRIITRGEAIELIYALFQKKLSRSK
ncbi:MAG TPA: FAD-dependent oxidoreductase [Dehalococcoidia bacterium]|jgi:hypothetical protein|nr:FAD-dependent oxidoreductase [Dehalococcoidia bacterium]